MRSEKQLSYDLMEVEMARLIEKKSSINRENEIEVLSASEISLRSYHELSDQPLQEVDLLTQVEQQVDILEDLIHRNSFLMKEVRYLLKK